jgi:hypothetical protein
MVNWLSTMHHNYEGALPSQEVDEKLEERVDCEGLGSLAVFSVAVDQSSPRKHHGSDPQTWQLSTIRYWTMRITNIWAP